MIHKMADLRSGFRTCLTHAALSWVQLGWS